MWQVWLEAAPEPTEAPPPPLLEHPGGLSRRSPRPNAITLHRIPTASTASTMAPDMVLHGRGGGSLLAQRPLHRSPGLGRSKPAVATLGRPGPSASCPSSPVQHEMAADACALGALAPTLRASCLGPAWAKVLSQGYRR